MRTLLMTVGVLVGAGCGTPAAPDGGTGDAGTQDGGPRCEGVPARLQSQAQCTSLDFYVTNACAGSAGDVLDAGKRPCGGGTGRVSCAGFDVVSWQYGPFGDTYQCFFVPDGGALRGAINFSDHGVLVAGSVADCSNATDPIAACDGGP